MRTNLPVTDVAYPIPPGVSIVSKTDLAGTITYANDVFVEISGYSREELIGQPHNLLRHPDMPAQAFAHMWKTLQAGNPWQGIVKNRRKDGGYYWVKAVVVPVRKDNQTIGYMSVRETASEAEIRAAEAQYKQIRSSGADIGENVLRNLLSIKAAYLLGTVFFILLLLSGGLLGIGGLVQSSDAVGKLYAGMVQPGAQAAQLDAEVQELRLRLAGVQAAEPAATANMLTQSARRMDALLASLRAAPLAPAEAGALATLDQRYQALATGTLAALGNALQAGDAAAFTAALPRAQADLQVLHATTQAFQGQAAESARDAQQQIVARNQLIGRIALAGLLFGIIIVLVVGRIFRKKFVKPLGFAIRSFDRIAQGDLRGEVDVYGKGETGQLIRASAVMQMHLKVITDEIYLVAKEVRQYCATLNGALFEIADHSEIQHDRLGETRNELSSSQAFGRDLEDKLARLRAMAAELDYPPAEFGALIDQVDNAIRLQSFAIDDFLARIEQITELVVENRQDTQGAYAMSERLQQEADRLYELVNYFSQDEKKPGQ